MAAISIFPACTVGLPKYFLVKRLKLNLVHLLGISDHVPRALNFAILRLIRLEWPISELSELGKIFPEGAKNSPFGPKTPVEFEPFDQKIFGQAYCTGRKNKIC